MIEGHEIKEIYDEYKQLILKVAYYYSKNPGLVEDIAHDTFMLFMADAKKKKSLDEYTSIKAWLSVTARNVAYNYNTKMKREVHISDESNKTLEMYLDEKVQEDSAEGHYLSELEQEKHITLHESVMAGLLKKNERWYEAIMLTYDMDISQVKAAGIMGMSTQSFYVMLHRAKKWIRKKYGVEYEELDEI